MAATPTNPYRPGRGVAPPVLAGRDAELRVAEGLLDQLEARRMPPRDLLFHGPRGNGKTTLLLEVARRAGRRGLRVETLPVDALSDRAALLRELQERAGHLRDRLTGRGVGPLGGAGERAPPTENASRLLLDWTRREPVPLVVLLDEIQALELGAGAAFFNALQAARAGSDPFLLICAGTPDGPRQLRRAAAHNERGFRRLRVGRLDREASLTALSEPASRAGLPMDSDAARFLAEETQDYPYFLQLLGSATWEAATASGAEAINLDIAREGARRARPEIEDFYGERFREAEARGVDAVLEPLANLFQRSGGTVRHPELREMLDERAGPGGRPADRTALLDVLGDLGILWETAPRVWELGIPSFADHILRHAAPRKSP